MVPASSGASRAAGAAAPPPTGFAPAAAALRRSGAAIGPAAPESTAPSPAAAARSGRQAVESLPAALSGEAGAVWNWAPDGGFATRLLALSVFLLRALLALTRWRARRRREYVRLRVKTYRTDKASAEAIVGMFEALHKRLLRRWWRRLLQGQPSIALEVHHARGTVWLAVTCPRGLEEMVQAALRTAYPNCRLLAERQSVGLVPSVLR